MRSKASILYSRLLECKCNLNFKLSLNFLLFVFISSGAYGEVRLALDKNACEKYAIKIISKKKFTMGGRNQIVNSQSKLNALEMKFSLFFLKKMSNAQIMSEVNILKKLEHVSEWAKKSIQLIFLIVLSIFLAMYNQNI